MNEMSAANLATAINRGIFYKSEYKKCMKDKGYYEEGDKVEAEKANEEPVQPAQTAKTYQEDVLVLPETPTDKIVSADLIAQAEKGDVQAQYSLGVQYMEGAMPEDKIKAYVWLYLAAEHGFTKAALSRYEVSQVMTQADIATAKRLALKKMGKYTW